MWPGAGVVGTLLAFNLSKLGATNVVIVDGVGVGAGLSGNAGGYVPRNCYTVEGPMQTLAHVSFALHSRLAEELDGPTAYGYRRLSTLSIEAADVPDGHGVPGAGIGRVRDGDSSHKLGHHLLPPWADGPNIGKVRRHCAVCGVGIDGGLKVGRF